MNLQSRIESLKARHAGLETRISEEDHRPLPDSGMLSRLKVEKLRLKEELERLAHAGAGASHRGAPEVEHRTT